MANPGKAMMIVVLPFGFLFYFMSGIRDKGADFSTFQALVAVTSSKITYAKEAESAYISTIGTIKNNSEIKWKDVQIEVQYFDKDDRLIDTQTQSEYDFILVPHSEQAFRLRQKADKPETNYVAHKVFIRNAVEAPAHSIALPFAMR